MDNQPVKNKFFSPSSKYNISKLPDSIISVLTPEKSKNTCHTVILRGHMIKLFFF
jgi:hypothetical protein